MTIYTCSKCGRATVSISDHDRLSCPYRVYSGIKGGKA